MELVAISLDAMGPQHIAPPIIIVLNITWPSLHIPQILPNYVTGRPQITYALWRIWRIPGFSRQASTAYWPLSPVYLTAQVDPD